MSQDVAAMKPQMLKPYVWLQTVDGSIQQVEQEVAKLCPMICREIQKDLGFSKNHAISLPELVNPAMLSLILDYCRFHRVQGRSNKELRSFDEKLIRMDTKRLCELTSAADSLQLKPLVDLTSHSLAKIIEGKTPDEIREIFHLPDDLTEEEKLEPLKIITDDPRIRLLNRLNAKKRKELKQKVKLKNIDVEEEHEDGRSVDDLVSYIDGRNGVSKGTKTSKNKKKHRRKRDKQNGTSSNLAIGTNIKVDTESQPYPHDTSRLQDIEEGLFISKVDCDDVDNDDEIDPALKEEIDR